MSGYICCLALTVPITENVGHSYVDRPTSPWIILPRAVTMLYPETTSHATGSCECEQGLYSQQMQQWKSGLHRPPWTGTADCRRHKRRTRTAWMFLLLLLSGNIHPNPGPELTELETPSSLENSNGLRFTHLNVRSLLNKIDCWHMGKADCDVSSL